MRGAVLQVLNKCFTKIGFITTLLPDAGHELHFRFVIKTGDIRVAFADTFHQGRHFREGIANFIAYVCRIGGVVTFMIFVTNLPLYKSCTF